MSVCSIDLTAGIMFGSKKSLFVGKSDRIELTNPELEASAAVTVLSANRISFASLTPNCSGKVFVLHPSGD